LGDVRKISVFEEPYRGNKQYLDLIGLKFWGQQKKVILELGFTEGKSKVIKLTEDETVIGVKAITWPPRHP